MKLNRRFNVFGTIGDGSILRCVPRKGGNEIKNSFHVMRDKEEIGIAYTLEHAAEIAQHGDAVVKKPVFRQYV